MELNTESVLLKALISNNEFFGKSMPILKYQYFTDLGNQHIFKLLGTHYNKYKAIPTVMELVTSIQTVPNEETRSHIINNIRVVNSIDCGTNTEFLLDSVVTFVKDAMYTEALILGSDALSEKSEEKKIKAKSIMEEMSKVSIDTDLGLDWDDIETMIKYYQEKLVGIRTQHDELNKRIGSGFLPKTLSIIMAASGVGKCSKKCDVINIYIKDEEYDIYMERLNEIRSRKCTK